jgi:thiamine pyrophosphate-dependent acetolactate synthase large subunit-like protein
VNYTLVDIPRPKQKFVHIHAGAEELGRVYQGDLMINSGMPEFAAAARALSPVHRRWDEWTEGARADFEAWQQSVSVPGRVNMSEVVHFLRARLPPETIVTNGAGNFSIGSIATPGSGRSLVRRAARWVTPYRLPLPQNSSTRSAPWCRSRAMATFS